MQRMLQVMMRNRENIANPFRRRVILTNEIVDSAGMRRNLILLTSKPRKISLSRHPHGQRSYFEMTNFLKILDPRARRSYR